MTEESEQKIVKLRTDEQVIKNELVRKHKTVFGGIEAHLQQQADALIELAKTGTLSQFTAQYPINPSVVHIIIMRLLNRG